MTLESREWNDHPPIPNQRNLSRFLIPAHSGKKAHVCQDTSTDVWTMDVRTDRRLHNSDSRDEGSRTRESIVPRAVHKGRRLGGRGGREGSGFGNLVHRQ